MPLPSASFLIGLVVTAYLGTFVIFAVLRIITGISIQRVGYTGIRRIAFSPRHGIRIHIRGIGLTVHKPTFAQPTWISVKITEPHVTLDLRALGQSGKKDGDTPDKGYDEEPASPGTQREKWRKLTVVKEKLKKLHRHVKWMKLVDTVITGAKVTIQDVGTLGVERVTLAVDTRAKIVDRSRLFQHHTSRPETQTPAEWKSIIRTILFTPEGKESMEVLDYCAFSVHGFLHNHLEGLRDATISLKLGRLALPYDDLVLAADKVNKLNPPLKHAPGISINDVPVEPTSTLDDKIVDTISGSQEFIGSILRGIQEVQLAIGFIGMSKRIESFATSKKQVYLNLAVKEIGLDLLRLDSRSPAHRMYFSHKDVAHQALLTAISISAGVDDGNEYPERMLYVPMITATIKTTLPSKTVQYADELDARERNNNILFANFVCTSPSLDLDPKHLPLLLAIAKARESSDSGAQKPSVSPRGLVSRLLPKANIKMAVQEPVIRVSLPPLNPSFGSEADYDLLISSTSTIAMDIEAEHSAETESHYNVAVSYRQTSQSLYYQSNAGDKHDLLQTDTVEVKIDVSALPEVTVHTSANFQSFSVFLVRPEISEGIRQIVQALTKETTIASKAPEIKKPSFLRLIPAWAQHVNLKGSDFNVELAGIDTHVSKYSRGFALHLESWSAEYKAHRDDVFDYMPKRRSRSITRSISRGRGERATTPTDNPRRKPSNPTDGRRLALHIQDLEGFIIDSVPDSTADPFIALPKFEVAFSTSTDAHGPLFHVNSHAKSLQIQYSIYNYFAIGVAILTFRRMFVVPGSHSSDPEQKKQHPGMADPASRTPSPNRPSLDEITTLDFKANLVQVKAEMPSDPPLMLQIFGIDAGRHRWATPFARTKLVRLYAGTPGMESVWSRIISIKALRLDFREMRIKHGNQVQEEKSIDISTEAIRLGVPHGLVLHAVFDNIINVLKASEQLHHHFKTGSDEYILAKHPEGPKKVPRISVRSQVLVFEIEDSPFEWKLGTIYRVGLIEQQQRLARAEAFRLKVKKMETPSQRRGSSRMRATSAQASTRSRSQSQAETIGRKRSKSYHQSIREESPNHGTRRRGRKMRYDADGKCELSGTGHVSIDKAFEKLQKFNAESWKKRIDRAMYEQGHVIKDLRQLLMGIDELPEESEQHEAIVGIPQRPALLCAIISDVGIIVDKPSFALNEYPKFLHDVGKGMPMDMKYGLLVPMGLKVTMGEARISLRDYPLPFIHIPAITPGQSPRLSSLSLTTDFVVAEEFQDLESQRHMNVVICPEDKLGKNDIAKRFAIDVRRTISAVKTYSDMKIEVNSSAPTRITWGTSYQPAIQDMMQVIENFTKPPMDPSDRVGFWDKIRLAFHSRIEIAWKGDGDVHLCLKGSRSPYIVTGNGAGFVMVWRNNVRLQIAQDEDPRKFLSVESGDYLLAVPDFNNFAKAPPSGGDVDLTGASSTTSTKNATAFKKVVMKLSGNVRWLVGLMFERDLEDGQRTFDFCPHYNVVLKHPDHAKAPPGKTFDAYRAFRSHHIHMSISIVAPQDRDWNVSNLKPSKNYNSVHLTPRFFTHFFDWWSLFSGVMSLPVRQGPLWSNTENSSKKFGRHLATIKYSLLFSPLFLSHIYKHKDAEDYQSDVVYATGLKMKLDSFMLDLHQRRETFEIPGHGDAKPKRTTQMKINQAQLDFISADIRAISATITGTSSKDIDEADDESLAQYQAPNTSKVDMSKFTIPDNDFTWIDMDDFVELDWILPAESNPETKILPLTFGPRFTYFRQTDHGDTVSGDPTRTSPFGDEPTHFCVISEKNDPRRVQAELIRARLDKIEEQIAENEHAVGEQELKVIRDTQNTALAESLEALKEHTEALQKKHTFLGDMHRVLLRRLEHDDASLVPTLETADDYPDEGSSAEKPASDSANMESSPFTDYMSDFNNRFVVHNPQIKWSNSLRNIILRYIHQVGQRRGFVYYMSRRAVKFILDIIDERQKAKEGPSQQYEDGDPLTPGSPGEDDDEIQERIEELLRDGKNYVSADEAERRQSTTSKVDSDGGHNISTEYTPQNTYHFRLIAPQIQLQSEKNPKSVILIAAKGMQLKVVQIMDKDRVMDEVSGLVQHRFSANMDSLQVFVTSTKTFSTEFLHMYSGNHYGGKPGDHWPPWVPLEVMFEFTANPYGFNRVVHRTLASLRYEKYNNLRLKYNEDVSDGRRNQDLEAEEANMDNIWIEFPHFRAICDSAQYYAMYLIVMDLLLYSEPLEKTRTERLEKIMLASDFSDLRGAPEMVEMLQHRIHQLEDIKMHFQINESELDRQGWKDRIAVDQDLASCEDELFFIMKAITTSQRRIGNLQEASTGLLRWLISSKEIAWHLVRGESESLVEFQLRDAQFFRTDNNDGSNHNCVEIGRINGFNLLPNAVYPEIIAPYVDPARGFHKQQSEMLRVQWLQLEAIAGIQVVDSFEVNVMPLRVQLEREVAKKLFEYIFPGVGGSAFEGAGLSPFALSKMGSPQEQNEESTNGDDQEMASINGDGHKLEDPNGVGTGAGDLEHRLQPTMKLPDKESRAKKQGFNLSNTNLHWNPFTRSNDSTASLGQKKNGYASSVSNLSIRSTSEKSLGPSDNLSLAEDKKRPGTSSSGKKKDKDKDKDKDQPSDDLTEMMNRASNYMTLAFFKIPSTVLCLSYKGRGQRNLEDVHDLVFRLPTFEYRNKTWSNLDLALQIKKDLIKALISHTGAIIGNKFSHHRPNRQQAASRLKEIANMSTILTLTGDNEEDEQSVLDLDVWNDRPRPSFTSGRPSTMARSMSSTSSLHKVQSASSATPDATPMMADSQSLRPLSRSSQKSDIDNRPHTHAGETGKHLIPPPPAPWNVDKDVSSDETLSSHKMLTTMVQPARNRSGSIGQKLSAMGQRMRAQTADLDDTDDG